MTQRVYIDTSVIGGCFDKEFEKWSNKLFEEFTTGKLIAVVSDITLDELSNAPKFVVDNFKKIPETSTEMLLSNEDALHIAIATIEQVNVLASWNFKHIVNLERIRKYNSVNLKNGYKMIEIRTPREILTFNEE